MKAQRKSYLLLTIAILTSGLFTITNAQRNDRKEHSQNHNQDRSSQVRSDRGSSSDRGRSDRPVSQNRIEPQRNQTYVTNTRTYRTEPNRVLSTQRVGDRGVTSNYRNYRNDRDDRNYRGYQERRYVLLGGPRYRSIPYGYSSYYYGGRPYYYNRGLFYYMLDGFYQSIYPPFGIRIRTLPYGYVPLYVGPDQYYYYNGIYYRQYDNLNYEVVNPPMGAVVTSLPPGSKSVNMNGEKFYELNGTYYKEGVNSKGEVNYTVVGKYGEINNTDNGQPSGPMAYKAGDILPELPNGCKTITLNGEKLFVSPDDIYFKEIRDGNQISYQVVGLTN